MTLITSCCFFSVLQDLLLLRPSFYDDYLFYRRPQQSKAPVLVGMWHLLMVPANLSPDQRICGLTIIHKGGRRKQSLLLTDHLNLSPKATKPLVYHCHISVNNVKAYLSKSCVMVLIGHYDKEGIRKARSSLGITYTWDHGRHTVSTHAHHC